MTPQRKQELVDLLNRDPGIAVDPDVLRRVLLEVLAEIGPTEHAQAVDAMRRAAEVNCAKTEPRG